MPVEIFERHVAGVAHGKVVAHLAPRQSLGVAPFGDNYAQVGGLVEVADLDDLACVF